MKRLKWPTNADKAAYMRMRKTQNRSVCHRSRAENWAAHELASRTAIRWNRQAAWGNRLFDFWNASIGCAVEIDGPEHRAAVDAYRDEYVFRRSAIVVLRVGNFDDSALNLALQHIEALGTHSTRRKQIGIAANTKAEKRWLADLPYPPSYLSSYLEQHHRLNGRRFVIDQTSPKLAAVKLVGRSAALPVWGDDEQLEGGVDDAPRR